MKKKFLAMFIMAAVLISLASVEKIYAASEGAASISGKVVETMDSGRYTYVCLEKSGKKTWLAVPQMKVTKGKNMSFQPGVEMTNFESKTLKRTFEKIIFSAGPTK